MKELIISEFSRMRSRKKNKICLLIMLFSFIFSVIWYKTSFLGCGIGFYAPNIKAEINSLNFTVFFLKDMTFILFILVLPMLFTDSLSGEFESGDYRLILTRPYTRTELWLSKLIVQCLFTMFILVTFFILSTIIGYVVFPKVITTTFYTSSKVYNATAAFVYNFKIIVLLYLVSNAILAIAALISSIIPKVVASFIILLSFLIGSVYVGHGVDILVMPFDKIIRLLSLGERQEVYIPVIGFLIIGLALSILVFNKKDLRI
ncbi:ABC transporter permease [Clostridium sp. FP2]|uniref:ABC transporter permease subunit n=1 Tax=Clostridium sp. FP2 TaxID=2724481 RepID=UPI0013E980DA|nr:ABC transporter permease subunit [Clostridium sp. FP2]MBZ9623983.1 ABC transporter permease [Clostridium sp. FP2]